MALKLALVIEGDAGSAKQALAEVGGDIQKLGATTAKANEASAKTAYEAQEASLKASTAAREAAADQAVIDARAKRATLALKDTGQQAQTTGTAFVSMRGVATGAIGGIIGVIGGVAGGVVAGTLIGAFQNAIGAAAGLAQEIFTDGPKIERSLKAHEGLVKRITEAYARARGAASDYGKDSQAVLTFETQQNVKRLRESYQASLGDMLPGAMQTGLSTLNPFAAFDTGLGYKAGMEGPFRELIAAFRKDLKAGTADINAFRTEVGKIASTLKEDSPYRTVAEDILKATEKSAGIQIDLQQAIDLFKGLTGDANAAATALGGTAEKFENVGSAVGGVNPALREYNELMEKIAARGAVPGSSVAPLTSGGAYTPYAAGGAVVGPGTGTSDSMLALVSNGEFIVNAAATARHRPLLEAINGAAPGFAAGGIIPRFAAGGAVASGSGTVAGLSTELEALRGAARDFVQALEYGVTPLRALSEAALSFSRRLLDIAYGALDKAIFGDGSGNGGLLGSLFGALMGGGAPLNILPAGVGHSGAMIGAPATPLRLVPARVFASAPRMHGGGTLGPDEMPFIGKRGEEIDWPENLARRYGGGTTVFNISTPNPRAFAENRATVARAAGRFMASARRHL